MRLETRILLFLMIVFALTTWYVDRLLTNNSIMGKTKKIVDEIVDPIKNEGYYLSRYGWSWHSFRSRVGCSISNDREFNLYQDAPIFLATLDKFVQKLNQYPELIEENSEEAFNVQFPLLDMDWKDSNAPSSAAVKTAWFGVLPSNKIIFSFYEDHALEKTAYIPMQDFREIVRTGRYDRIYEHRVDIRDYTKESF